MTEITLRFPECSRSHGEGVTKQDLDQAVQRIMATQTEAAATLQALKVQLTKANDEIQAKIAALVAAGGNSDNLSPELAQAIEDLKPAAQVLDDIVPDVVPPPTGPTI